MAHHEAGPYDARNEEGATRIGGTSQLDRTPGEQEARVGLGSRIEWFHARE